MRSPPPDGSRIPCECRRHMSTAFASRSSFDTARRWVAYSTASISTRCCASCTAFQLRRGQARFMRLLQRLVERHLAPQLLHNAAATCSGHSRRFGPAQYDERRRAHRGERPATPRAVLASALRSAQLRGPERPQRFRPGCETNSALRGSSVLVICSACSAAIPWRISCSCTCTAPLRRGALRRSSPPPKRRAAA